VRVIVDADSMPVRIREIVCTHAARRGFDAVFFANSRIPLPDSSRIAQHTVDDADEAIVETVAPADLVVTHDIPLAARVVEKGAAVLDDRGSLFTAENIGERLSHRDFAHDLREAGVLGDRARPFGRKEVQAFANAFDRVLTARGLRAGGRS